MKTNAILALLITATLFACKKEDDNNDDTQTPVDNTLQVNYSHVWQDGDFIYDQVYQVGGVNLTIQDFRYFLSNFVIEDDEDNEQATDIVVLMDASLDGSIDFGKLDHAHVHKLNLGLGLDDVTNHQDPTPADAPLNDASMHWLWSPEQGYKFIRIEGMVDPEGDGTYEAFSIHAATDELYRTTHWMIHETADGALEANLTIDIYKFLQNVDFSQSLSGTHGASDLTNGIADDAVENAFTID